MMFWLFSLPQFRLFRGFSVSTSNFALGDDSLEFEDGMDKGRYIIISRTREEEESRLLPKSILRITSVFLVLFGFIMD